MLFELAPATSVSVGLRLGAPLCLPHLCHHCSDEVDCLDVGGVRAVFHAAINGIIYQSLQHSANVPSLLEPLGLYWSDDRRTDDISIIP